MLPVVVDEPQVIPMINDGRLQNTQASTVVIGQIFLIVVHPLTVFLQFQKVGVLSLAIEYPQIAFVVVFQSVDKGIVVAKRLTTINGSTKRTVLLVMVLQQFAVLELIECATASYSHMSGVRGVYVDSVVINVGIAGNTVEMFLIRQPVVAVPNLYDARSVQVGTTRSEIASDGIQFSVYKLGFSEVVILRSSGLQRLDSSNIFLPIAVAVRRRQVGGIFRMILGVGVADFCTLHVHLDDTKAGVEISISIVDGQTVDGLVVSHRLAIECRDVGDVAVKINEVDVGVGINGNETLDLLVPRNMGDIGVAETIHLIIGGDALVRQVILIEAVGSAYEEIVIGLHYLLWFSV